jgi:putative regulator of septum formation
VDSATVQRQLSTTCPRKLQEYVGGSTDARRLSRLNVVWYSPTLDESDQGADWFRCDVIAFAGQDRLAALPGGGRLHGVLNGAKGLSRYGLCGTAAPGAHGFQRVICSRKHSWQAITTIGLAGGARYPGAAAVRKAGDGACKDRARSRSGNTLKFRYGWEWPTRQQWSRGQHYGFCWVPS